jgi:hypothetical protein
MVILQFSYLAKKIKIKIVDVTRLFSGSVSFQLVKVEFE